MDELILNREIMLRVAVANEVKIAKEFATKEELFKYLKEHPKADKKRHKVSPSIGKPKVKVDGIKQKNIKDKDTKKKKLKPIDDARLELRKTNRSDASRHVPSDGTLRNLSIGAKGALSNLPKKVRETIIDKDKRNKSLTNAGNKLLKSSKKFGKKIVKNFTPEMKGSATKGVRKILNKEKPTKQEIKSMAVIAVKAGAEAALLGGHESLEKAKYAGKALTKYAVLTAINPLINNVNTITQGTDTALKLAKDKEYTDEQLTAIWTQAIIEAVAKKLKEGMSDEETEQALNGKFPKIDLTNIEFGEDDGQTD